MSENKNLNLYVDKITNLKKEFVSIYEKKGKKASSELNEILKKMRILHGHAIYDNFCACLKITKNNLSDIDYIDLSVDASFLHIMHNHIRYCERLAHGNGDNTSPENNSHTTVSYNKHPVEVNHTEELSIDIPDTETANKALTKELSDAVSVNDLFEKPQSGGFSFFGGTEKNTDMNTTEYINNITTGEAARLMESMGSTDNNHDILTDINSTTRTSLDTEKPTLIYYWADWCGYSQKFNPVWKDFKKVAHKVFPNLQIVDLNVARDEELNKLAHDAGVDGYPTIVLFINGKKYQLVASRSSVDDIKKFLKEKLSKQ